MSSDPEYKHASSENVINQGIFYLDWLTDHRKDFQWLVMEKLGKTAAGRVDWSVPQLICIAGDFNGYDNHAVKQMQRNLEDEIRTIVDSLKHREQKA